MTAEGVTTAQAGLFSCHVCSLVCAPVAHAGPDAGDSRCPRCGARLHRRKPDSVARTWALLIAAYILYVPANLLPIMETRSLFDSQQDTIMSGVVFLWVTGSWPLAAIVFVASIVVPLAKMIALTLLTASVQWRSAWRTQERARLYRMVELVGRWSMLDIYVITIMVALVQIQSLASIKAGPAAAAFGGVVVLTMFAAMTFDPRLIWDPVSDGNEDD